MKVLKAASPANAASSVAMPKHSSGALPAPTKGLGRWILMAGILSILLIMVFRMQWLGGSGASGQDRASAKPVPAPIDGPRAFGYLKQICDIGPRIAGSEANAQQRTLVANHFRKLGATIHEQTFQSRDPLTGRPVTMVNLIGSWFPERAERVVIGAHYDSRPYPDEERDPERRRLPFIGANDGASGVALLMEMAHHLAEKSTPWGVDLVLFDGEELVYDTEEGRLGEFFLGSKEFAKRYKAERRSSKKPWKYVCGIVLDMVGGRDLEIPKEPHSVQAAGTLVRELWLVAKAIGASAFVDRLGREVLDDHLSLNYVDIPTADIIDFEYPHWHKASDIPENCDPKSLELVGRVVTGWLSLPKPAAKRGR